MIVEYYGDLLESQRQTLVCTTNCRGAMGAGLALAFKKRYPASFGAYRELYDNGMLAVDRIHRSPLGDNRRFVLFFPTKDHWKDPSQLHWVEHNLNVLARQWSRYGITSLAMPVVGTGLGGLAYDMVYHRIHALFDDHPLRVDLYVPN